MDTLIKQEDDFSGMPLYFSSKVTDGIRLDHVKVKALLNLGIVIGLR